MSVPGDRWDVLAPPNEFVVQVSIGNAPTILSPEQLRTTVLQLGLPKKGTEWANPASVRVLEKSGFARTGGPFQGGGARFQFSAAGLGSQ